MWQVNIYLETDSTYQRSKKRHSGIVLECRKKSGELETREFFFTREATYNQTVLLDLIEGLKKLNTSCEICICTSNGYVASSLRKFPEMMAVGFLDRQGKTIRNQEEWIQLYNLVKEHIITVNTEKHSYSGWMKRRMEELENEEKEGTESGKEAEEKL